MDAITAGIVVLLDLEAFEASRGLRLCLVQIGLEGGDRSKVAPGSVKIEATRARLTGARGDGVSGPG